MGNFQKEGVFLAESGFFVSYFCRRSPPAALAGADVIRWGMGSSSVLATLCQRGNAVVKVVVNVAWLFVVVAWRRFVVVVMVVWLGGCGEGDWWLAGWRWWLVVGPK